MATDAPFIIAAYSAAAIVMAALIAWIALDYRALTRKLADYERRGLTRGSGGA
jgi:heme exporter protein CcmD